MTAAEKKKIVRVLLGIALFCALSGGSVSLYIAFVENSMYEFYSGSTIDYAYSAEWFFASVVYFGLIVLAIESPVWLIVWFAKRKE